MNEVEETSISSSYSEYEKKIKKVSAYESPYATASVDDSDEEKHVFGS